MGILQINNDKEFLNSFKNSKQWLSRSKFFSSEPYVNNNNIIIYPPTYKLDDKKEVYMITVNPFLGIYF